MNKAARPSQYQAIKHLLEQIDRAEFARKMIVQADQAVKNNDIATLIQLGFSTEQTTELMAQHDAGKLHPHFANTTVIDNVIKSLRYELAEVVKRSIHAKIKGSSGNEISLTSISMTPEQPIDYFTNPCHENKNTRAIYTLPGKYGISFVISSLVDSVR